MGPFTQIIEVSWSSGDASTGFPGVPCYVSVPEE